MSCRELDLEKTPLLPDFQARCPLKYQRPTLEEIQKRDMRPYLFGGLQRPSCKNCHWGGIDRVSFLPEGFRYHKSGTAVSVARKASCGIRFHRGAIHN